MSTIFTWKDSIPSFELERVVDALTAGELVIFPTDTVYGLACDCRNESAIRKIFSAKHRPLTKPINILTDSLDKIRQVAKDISPTEENLIKTYLPGPLTVVLDKSDSVPSVLTASLPTIGVRIPDNTIALKILNALDFPLAVTSVNLSDEAPGLELSDFESTFKNDVAIIIDGGPAQIGVPSTIVRVEEKNTPSEHIFVLRPGALKF